MDEPGRDDAIDRADSRDTERRDERVGDRRGGDRRGAATAERGSHLDAAEARLDAPTVDDAVLDGLGGALLWRVGRVTDDGPVTVRVGFATAAPLFAELPRLRTATDAEVEEAIREDGIAVEWVGPRPMR